MVGEVEGAIVTVGLRSTTPTDNKHACKHLKKAVHRTSQTMTSISDEKKRKKTPNKQKQQNEQWHDAVTGGGPDTLLGYTNV